MKVTIDKDNTLYFTKLYPYMRKRGVSKPYQALLGVGGNIGDVRRRFNHLFISLLKSPFITVVETAPILKNPPFGYLEQDYFYNSLILVGTNLSPKALLRYILLLEKRFGRKRPFQDAPRTLDIDIIFYEDIDMESRDLIIPHHAWRSRPSVTIPLSYMQSRYIQRKRDKIE